MSTYIFDIDGTILNYHTNKWLPGAKEKLIKLHSKGHQILFITMRGPQDEGTVWNMKDTTDILNTLGIPYRVVFGVDSPRILIDDSKIDLIRRKRNQSWE